MEVFRSRLGKLLMILGFIVALAPVGQYVHIWVCREPISRGGLVLASETALDPISQTPSGAVPPGASQTGGTLQGTAPSAGTGSPLSTAQSGNGGTIVETKPVWRIQIPKLRIDRVLQPDVTAEALKLGPGVYPQGAKPGELGNICIAGHRNVYGSPFWYLDRLVPGDEIRITDGTRAWAYIVERVLVIEPTDWSVIAPTDYGAMTLTTCHPLGSTAQRLVVRGRLDRVIREILDSGPHPTSRVSPCAPLGASPPRIYPRRGCWHSLRR